MRKLHVGVQKKFRPSLGYYWTIERRKRKMKWNETYLFFFFSFKLISFLIKLINSSTRFDSITRVYEKFLSEMIKIEKFEYCLVSNLKFCLRHVPSPSPFNCILLKYFSMPIFLLESILQRCFTNILIAMVGEKRSALSNSRLFASSPRSRPDMGRFN